MGYSEDNVSKTRREGSVEVLRVLLMFGVCILHCNNCAGSTPLRVLNYWLVACVDTYVFISGYYGIRFLPSKIIRLYVLAYACALTSYIVIHMGIFQESCVLISIIIGTSRIVSGGYWFLHAYVFMMCLAPIINAVLPIGSENYDEQNKRARMFVVIPMLLIIFGWGFLAKVTCSSCNVVPMVHGLEEYSGLTLVGVYIFARMYRMLNLDKRMPISLICVILMAFPVLIRLGFNSYNSPVVLLMAMAIFTLFIKYKSFLSPYVNRYDGWKMLGPSIFAVYLLHAHSEGYAVIKSLYIGWPMAILVFVACIVIDIPRRICASIVAPVFSGCLRLVDEIWSRNMICSSGKDNDNLWHDS